MSSIFGKQYSDEGVVVCIWVALGDFLRSTLHAKVMRAEGK